jgi:folate-binding protein YgfZ
MLIAARGDGLLLDVEAGRAADLARRLSLYRLRARVTVTPLPDRIVVALWGDGVADWPAPVADAVVYADPRHPALGRRAILTREAVATPSDPAAYDRHRLALGVPDGSRDLDIDKALLLESRFEELDGVDFKKGCYIGQELTARTKYRGLVKKRLTRVRFDGEAPPIGTPINQGGREAGVMRSSRDGVGLAVLRLDRADPETEPLLAGHIRIFPQD